MDIEEFSQDHHFVIPSVERSEDFAAVSASWLTHIGRNNIRKNPLHRRGLCRIEKEDKGDEIDPTTVIHKEEDIKS